MRNLKSILVLLLGIALLAAANIALVLYRGDSARIVRRTTLVDASLTPTRITLVRGKERMTLAKAVRWRLAEPFAGSADEQVVMKLLDALVFTPIRDTVSDSELLRISGRTRTDLSLDDPRLKIELSDATTTTTVSFGSLTPAKDGVYTAVDGVDSVLVMPVSVLAAADLPVDALRRRSLFIVGPETVEAVDVKLAASARMSFVRDGEQWKVDGRPASATRVRGLIDGVFSASVVSFVWPVGATNESQIASSSLLAAYGLDPESAVTVTFKCQDGVDRQVSFGKADESGQAYALVQNGGAIVTVPAAVRECVAREQFAYTDVRLFPLEASAVNSFVLSDDDVKFVVARGENGAWRLESPVAAPADAESVDRVLASILSLSALDVRERGVAVSVLTNSEPLTVSRDSVLGQMRIEDLRSRDILNLVPKTARRIVVTRGDADARPTAVAFGKERGAWNVESSSVSGRVDEDAVARLLGAMNPLKSLSIVKLKVSAADLDAYGLDAPYLTVAFDQELEDAVRRNVIVGAKTDGGRFATVGSSDAVFVVPDSVVSAFEAPLVRE